MNAPILVLLSIAAIVGVCKIDAVPVKSGSLNWHKLAKRDTANKPPAVENKNESTQTSNDHKDQATPDNNGDNTGEELIEAAAESPILVDPMDSERSESADEVQSMNTGEAENDSNPDRSIDWQLLSGNPEDLERELEKRRRRRSVRSTSLRRQHRVRMLGRVGGRSRVKRNAYGELSPSDLLAAYEYLQERREEPRVALLDEPSDRNTADLASLIYELQGDNEEPAVNEADQEEDQQLLPGEYVAYQPEIRITPDQLAALELALSEQPGQDDQEEEIDYYPKDKRDIGYADPVFANDGSEFDQVNENDEPAAVYLIPSSVGQQAEYVPNTLPYVYQNPYNFYQTDEDPRAYEEAARIYEEEQLRRRIANLVDEINQQRRIDRRRRR